MSVTKGLFSVRSLVKQKTWFLIFHSVSKISGITMVRLLMSCLLIHLLLCFRKNIWYRMEYKIRAGIKTNSRRDKINCSWLKKVLILITRKKRLYWATSVLRNCFRIVATTRICKSTCSKGVSQLPLTMIQLLWEKPRLMN